MKRMVTAGTIMTEEEIRKYLASMLRIYIKTGKDQFLLNASVLQKVLKMSTSEFDALYNEIEESMERSEK